MNWFANHASILEAPDLIIHLGAGQCWELEVYEAYPDARICLVEPQRDLAEKLRRRARHLPNVEVHEAVIAAEAGPQRFFELSHPLLSSGQRPSRIDSLYPGISITREREVEATTLGALQERLELPADTCGWLIADLPGTDTPLLESLLAQGSTGTFTDLFIRLPNEALYDTAATAESLDARPEDMGLLPIGAADRSDPDWTWFHLGIVPQLATLRQQIEALRNKLEILQETVEVQSGELIERKAEIQSLSESKQALMAETAAKAQEFSRVLETAGKEKIANLEKQLEQCKAKALNEKGEQGAEITRLNESLEKAQSDLAVSLRLQALRESDLKDLQARFGEVTELKNKQHELLVKLGQRLGTASEFLKQLNTPDDAGHPKDAADRLAEALTGEPESGR